MKQYKIAFKGTLGSVTLTAGSFQETLGKVGSLEVLSVSEVPKAKEEKGLFDYLCENTERVESVIKDDTNKKVALESELTETLRTNDIMLWKGDLSRFFYGEYKGLIYRSRTVRGVFGDMLQKDIEETLENLKISCLIQHILEEFPTTSIKLSMKNNDYFKAASQGTWAMDRTVKGALVNMYDNILLKQGE